LKATTTRDRDRRLVNDLADLEPEKRTHVLAQVRADEALRDVGADLTIDKVRDVLEYAPTAKLAQQIRNALVRALDRIGQAGERLRSRADRR
jgi:hypothetical protein